MHVSSIKQQQPMTEPFLRNTGKRSLFKWRLQRKRVLAYLLSGGGLLILWQSVVWLGIYPKFIIPEPVAVWETFWRVLTNGILFHHVFTSLSQMLVGLFIGSVIGIVLGYLLAKSTFLETVLSPLIVALQSTPVVAYAPLLVIWFGSGATSKIVTCVLIVFFPILMNTIIGIRSVPNESAEFMRLLNANRWDTLLKLEIPASLPTLLGGLKVSATLAMIGVAVGEFIQADAGIGFWIKLSRERYDTAQVIVGVITMAVIARLMYGMVSLFESRLLHWQNRSSDQ